ncbi:DUF4153 domain-containing protein [Rhodovulum imhoffii]|nr:DUF4153 domain-containing protein [Rhodovulum imhoffii]
MANRLGGGFLGLMAGVAAWLLLEILPEHLREAQRLLLFLGSFGAVFFVAALALNGPLALHRALLSAAVQAPVVSGLVVWGSLRFDTVSAYMDKPHAPVAFLILLFLPLPFAAAAQRPGVGWTHYPTLFHASWMIVVRFAAAWLFVGLVWAVVFLSNALLSLVEIDVIETLIEQEPVPFLLSGVTLGLALSVVNELSDYVSPYLILRLLRLLLPAVLVVVAVFLLALPLRGLSHLFGAFSAAATLLTMAVGAVTLISAAVDSGAERQVQASWMCFACKGLALLVPALGVLAGVAVWLRVAQYGLTPDRVVAGLCGVIMLAYGVLYGVAVPCRDWGVRIRRANTRLALVVLALAAAWFTPALDVYRLSAENQVARLEAGKASAEEIDLWAIGREWGRAGAEALERIAGLRDHPEAGRLAERLAVLGTAESRYAFDREGEGNDVLALAAAVRGQLQVRPEGAVLPEGLLRDARLWELEQILQGCDRRTPLGNPGCVLLLADLTGERPGDEAVLVAQSDRGAPLMRAYLRDAEGYSMRAPGFLDDGLAFDQPGALIDAILTGAFRLLPLTLQALEVEGGRIYFGP